jgi:hypothetical protein
MTDYRELQEILDRLEVIRLALVRQQPTHADERPLNDAYNGIRMAQSAIRSLLADPDSEDERTSPTRLVASGAHSLDA